MAVRIRLSRHGKKAYAYFHIVVTDQRSPRDGRFIERIGSYNPNTNPASIVLDNDKALDWLNKGAQPSDTARRILSYEGVLLRKHLQGGVTKGAITAEEAEKKFNDWKAEKEAKISNKKLSLAEAKEAANKEALSHEEEINKARAEEIAKRKAEEALALEKAKAEKEAAEKAALEEAKAAAEKIKSEKAAEEKPAEEAPAEKPEA